MAEYLGLIKTALRNTIQNVNFVDPIQTRRAHETLMHYVKRERRCADIKYSMQIDPLYFQYDKFIPTLEKHFPGILRWNIKPWSSKVGISTESTSVHTSKQLGTKYQLQMWYHRWKANTKTSQPQIPTTKHQRPSSISAFASAHQRNLTTIITMVKVWTPLIIQPIAPGMHHTLHS